MPKNRTMVGITDHKKDTTRKGLKTSTWLITINPNKSFYKTDSPEIKNMTARLQALGNYILSKKNLVKFIDFKDKDGNIIADRENQIPLIESYNDDRTAVVERNTKYQVHLHIYVVIKHRTYITMNRQRIGLATERITGIPASQMHINFQIDRNGFADYVKKHVVAPIQ